MCTKLLFAAMVLVGAASCKQGPGNEPRPQNSANETTGQRDAELLMSGIKPGMNLREIKAVLHQESFAAPDVHVREHGGVWCDIPIGADYLVQVRLSHPKQGRGLDESKINYSPRLRDRRSLKFVTGVEKSW
jgi:hypothetical protein